MFGGSRKHRVPAQPLTRETANPNAATAAASAFMRNEQPSPSLSSAAAAAALKARPTTPTNVAHVQSKRTQRRSASVSSAGSQHGRRELHRSPSSGSMTERTFRSPSPARSAAPSSHDVPPVPSLPQHGHYKADAPAPTHKKALSLQTQPFRTGSQRLKDGQGSWFGAAAAGDISNVRHSDDVINSIRLNDARPTSPSSSINFSYPRSQLESPTGLARPDSALSDHTMVYDPNSRRMVPRGELLMREQNIRDASAKPVKKKKQTVSRSGSHLSKGTVGRAKGTAIESSSTDQPADTSSHAPPTVQSSKAMDHIPEHPTLPESQISSEHSVPEETDFDVEGSSKAIHSESEASTVTPAEMYFGDTSQSSLIVSQEHAKPDQVKREAKEEARTTEISEEGSLPRTVTEDDTAPVKLAPPVSLQPDSAPNHVDKSTTPEPTLDDRPKQTESRHFGSVRRTRVHSESPQRTTHFAKSPDQLVVRHEPPPRALSPRKSALKQRSPTRDASPSEDGSELSGGSFRPGSHDDSGIARKKSVRVSFDDQNTVVVGESATPPESDSPILMSPQTKKPWHPVIGRHKREPLPLDEEETMTPRPTLPSFGSVREKKVRETEERPLVRPSESSWTPSQRTTDHGNSPAQLGQSSDFAIGSILASEQSAKHEANISKYREPLPPVVTSVDSSGYISNSTESSEDETEPEPKEQELAIPTSHTVTENQGNGSAVETKDFAKPKESFDKTLPEISITQPSPRADNTKSPDSPQDFFDFDVPGGFPADDTPEDSEQSHTPPAKEHDLEPENDEHETLQAETSHTSTPAISGESTPEISTPPHMHDIQEESEESENSSIYSDAFEDLSDMEGDGFMSLDAVVDSPVQKVAFSKTLEKAMAKSREKSSSKESTPTKAEFQVPLQTTSDWENAKAYWKSLSVSKRRQLEQEAMEEAGDESDLGELAAVIKAKEQKSLNTASREKIKAGKQRDPDRVYQIQPGTTWDDMSAPPPKKQGVSAANGPKIRKSMRTQEPAITHTEPIRSTGMRKSMRAGGAEPVASSDGRLRKSLRAETQAPPSSNPTMRKSLRADNPGTDVVGPRASLKKSVRPTSYQPTTSTQSSPNHRRNHSADAVGMSARPALARRGSDSSESSFRRLRSKGDGFGFRKTMRGSLREPAAPASDNGRGSSRFSLRSLSPSGSTFRRGSGTLSPPPVAMGVMRQSLRDTGDAGASRNRFGKSPGKKAKKPRGGSRFADSSDEDDVRPSFRSRFHDSSDDEDFSPQVKRNGLPKSLRNTTSSSAAAAAMGVPASSTLVEESSDLSDSDDEIVQPKRAATVDGTSANRNGSALNRSGSGRGSLAVTQPPDTSPTARPKHTRRGSFMSILRRKKDPADKISRDIRESAARRDTRLERSTEQLAVMRSNSNSNNARLHKRGPNWPLSEDAGPADDDDEETYVDEEKRPSTAGAVDHRPPTKPGLLSRRSTSQGVIGLPRHDAVSVSDVQKKKKFGTLRKMFGIHD